MTVKILASSMLLIGCFLFGSEMSRRMKNRKDTLKQLILSLGYIENYILSLKMPLPEIYNKLSGEKIVGDMFKKMYESECLDQKKLWERGLLELTIDEKDKNPLIELSGVLGNGNSEFVKKQIEQCISLLVRQYEEAESQYKAEGTLYRKMGVYMGVLLVLLLI